MPKQKITLAPDGIVIPRRMQPFSSAQATTAPGRSINRLRRLIAGEDNPKICVVRGEGVGDVIMTTPIVHAIKQHLPGAVITYATNTKYLDGIILKALELNPDIDEIIERQILHEADYDLTINLHCPCISYEKRENPPVNRIDLFAKHVGLPLTDPVPRFFLSKEEIDEGKDFVAPFFGEKLMMVQPSASCERRSLDHKVLKQACVTLWKKHQIKSLVVTHSTDFRTDTLWGNLLGGVELKNLDIRKLASIMVHCDLLLCPDSSLMHVAGALSVPTVAFFGPTHPDARVNHYKKAVAIWEGRNLRPCPCWYEGCPIGEACWSAITAEQIATTCIKQIDQTSRTNLKLLSSRNSDIILPTEII